MVEFKWVDGGSVTTPAGYKAAGVTAGFKRSGAPDFAMLYSELPATVGGAFTSCTFAAAPVQLCRRRLKEGDTFRAVIINSGNANACTGAPGDEAAEKSCAMAAEALQLKSGEIFAASTGRIGVQLDLETIRKGIELAVPALSHDGGNLASEAIMTTDTVPKSVAVQLEIGGKTISIGAMTKGAGMIDPKMKALHATMLCFITTDAALTKKQLADLVDGGIEQSFNRITVDGDMSTNDTVLLFANGASGVAIEPGSEEEALFRDALRAVMQSLARKMVMDGEGATKFVEIKIEHAPSYADAKKAAEAVANSLLCKTAWFGNDPNWGRVIAALGYSEAAFNPATTDIFYGDMPVVRNGGDAGTPEADLVEIVKQREFTVRIDFKSGDADYWVWTSDVSYEYVKINADYHT
ncbi:MAG: bifunctional glutamate N-acetyltransferase/amino-acid acetyltransferase ArgJ [Lentisphaeria bacterium]|nr:bifunctional glutamate N-acetyltransferase/amino-acid acetyltransferase ArgJ [Lentisphaeria bacterium]